MIIGIRSHFEQCCFQNLNFAAMGSDIFSQESVPQNQDSGTLLCIYYRSQIKGGCKNTH